MFLVLRPGLFHCYVSERALFLDLPADRYFCLSEDRNALFRAWSPGVTLLERPSLSPFVQSGLLIESLSLPPASKRWQPPDRIVVSDALNSVAMLSAVGRRLLVSASLRGRGLCETLRRNGLSERRCRHDGAEVQSRFGVIARAHAATDVLLGAHDKCLPRAIALAGDLVRSGADPTLVLGLALRPFQAHSWVQLGSALVNDEIETVRKFQPVLVL